MSLSESIKASRLYLKLACDQELLSALENIRSKAEALAETLVRDASVFTDHTIRHMDSLWSVTDKVLTVDEVQEMTTAEAFLLAAGFYLHDIGMSFAATAEGRQTLMKTQEYIGTLASAPVGKDAASTEQEALAFAIRVHHAHAAQSLAVNPIPGTSEYLIEPKSVRDQFGATCGQIAASHHWSIERVEAELGIQEIVPLANGREADVGFVAGVLRLIDYAHINRERAPKFARTLRPDLPADSAVHWDAQENIDGPSRSASGGELVYSSSAPISDVDAWWLFYEFARGLDSEIRLVHRFLKSRKVSSDRLSLVGVRGANSPSDFAKLVKTSGFLPLEVNVKTSSITRLVRLLAGESLYGKNFMAPVRELIQNSLDAVLLKRTVATTAADRAVGNLPIEVIFRTDAGSSCLSVRDWGIGMSKKVIVDHLLTIASDYWEGQFRIDFPGSIGHFSPAGRFGIGFLSVFMLGQEINVASQRTGSDRYSLSIRGLGKRAELRQISSESSSGTVVRVVLTPEAIEAIKDLPDLLPSFIPMIEVKVVVDWEGKESTIEPSWVLSLSTLAFKTWVSEAQNVLRKVGAESVDSLLERKYFLRSRYGRSQYTTPELEQKIWPLGAPEYREAGVRLVADQAGVSVLCLRGFALQIIRTPGFSGVINADDITPDAARRESLDFDGAQIIESAKTYISESVARTLTHRKSAGFLPEQLDFVTWCVDVYGDQVLTRSEFPWLQIVEDSGNSRFVSSDELVVLIGNCEAFFLGLNLGPNSLSRSWKRESQLPKRKEIGVCISGVSVGYSGEEKTGSLSDLCDENRESTLFQLFLSTISTVWGTSMVCLRAMPGFTHKSSEIAGFLTKP